MKIEIQNLDEKWYEQRKFLEGYGKFPYIILKAGHAMFMQIPINFNITGDLINYPGKHINGICEKEISDYQIDKTTELHNKLIEHCQRIKNKIETDYDKPCIICLVEGPETAYYFNENSIKFNTSIPSGGTLTPQYKILAINVDHYIL